MLQLNESCTNGRDVALLVGESHSARPLRILQLRVGVDSGVADAPVKPIHNHRKLNCEI